jgi:hypothetical protein
MITTGSGLQGHVRLAVAGDGASAVQVKTIQYVSLAFPERLTERALPAKVTFCKPK